jgi:hypothetical protein
VARHFLGNASLELSFSIHQINLWVGLTYEEESELSSIHNAISHDVNSESVIDRLFKLRLTWTRMGSFDWQGQSSRDIIEKKMVAWRSVGVNTKTEMNAQSWQFRIACVPQEFFDKVVQIAEAHREGKLKGMKAVGSDGRASKKAKKGVEVSLNSKYAGTEEGPEIKTQFFKDLAWVKLDADFKAIGTLLEQVRTSVITLDQFMENLTSYKDFKFLRIQLRVKVCQQL